MDYLAHVTKDIADLIPTFLGNRENEVDALAVAVSTKDLQRLQHLGERMFALGNAYGFRQITTFGRALRDAVATEDFAAAQILVEEYRKYLTKVQIVEVDAPVPRPQWGKPASNDEEMWEAADFKTAPRQISRAR